MSISEKQLNKTKEKLSKYNYRISSDSRCCCMCAHMEVFESGSLKGMHYCRPMEYHCYKPEASRSVCDNYMQGSREEALIGELADLFIETNLFGDSNKITSNHEPESEEINKLQNELEKCISELSRQKGLFFGARRRTLKKRITEINKELKYLRK